MPSPENELSNLSELRPEATGEPGQRTFRILADGERGGAVVWLEKEQLFRLSLAIQQLMATLTAHEAVETVPDTGLADRAPLEFKAIRLAVGHDAGRQMFVIDAHDTEGEDDQAVTLRLWATHNQVSDFAAEGLRVCAAGRPLCPLCAGPIDPEGHACPKVNGHAIVDGDGA